MTSFVGHKKGALAAALDAVLTQMSVGNWRCSSSPDFQTRIVDQQRHFIINRQDANSQGGGHRGFGSRTGHQSHSIFQLVFPIMKVLKKKNIVFENHGKSLIQHVKRSELSTLCESVQKLTHVNNHKAYNLLLFCREIEDGSS